MKTQPFENKIDIKDIKAVKNSMEKIMGKGNENEEGLAHALHKAPNKQQYTNVEYVYYDQQYQISHFPQELPLCIVSTSRNTMDKAHY